MPKVTMDLEFSRADSYILSLCYNSRESKMVIRVHRAPKKEESKLENPN